MKYKHFPERDDEIYYQIAEGVRNVLLAFVIVVAAGFLCASPYLSHAEFLAWWRLMLFGV